MPWVVAHNGQIQWEASTLYNVKARGKQYQGKLQLTLAKPNYVFNKYLHKLFDGRVLFLKTQGQGDSNPISPKAKQLKEMT